MSWLKTLGWSLLALITLAIGIGVFFLRLPQPGGAIVIDQATVSTGTHAPEKVALPHTMQPGLASPAENVRFSTGFDLSPGKADGLFLLIPAVNRRTKVTLNGEELFDSQARALWLGPLIGSTVLIHLPRTLLVDGYNNVTVDLVAGPFTLPVHLSRIFIGTEAAVAPSFKLHTFLDDRLKTMALAAQVLLGLGIILAYFFRPTDQLFAWLVAMVTISFFLSLAMFMGYQPKLQVLLPFFSVASSSLGISGIGVAFALVGRNPPRVLKILFFAIPAALLPLLLLDITSNRILVTLLNAPVLIVSFVVATGIVAWGAFWRHQEDARLMLAPYFLVCCFLIRDIWIILSPPEHSLMLVTPYVRPLFLAAVIVVLMRRLTNSLDRLDQSNETLQLKLAEREAELAKLHEVERQEAARLVREQERQRLTRDLHDGISGHLVSIIAMSERNGGDAGAIENAARQALDDLRLVIYSLDLGDQELPLALANFRERLTPQLRRMGVELDWSTANMPEVSGVTPANALVVLRILQEAITNALKHGPAGKITVRAAGSDEIFSIIVENDGRPFAVGKCGRGLENMRRRAAQLQGQISINPCVEGARLTLQLPRHLPDLKDSVS